MPGLYHLVAMRVETRNEYEQRVEAAVRLLRSRLDDRLNLELVASHAGFSVFHFHRIFQAITGETIGEMIRRLRLERAAHELRSSSMLITEIAFGAGYATHEAFVRAFRQAYGCKPSWFRSKMIYPGELPTPNGVHYRDGDAFVLRFASQGDREMKVDIREIQDRKAVCLLHKGPYFMIGQTFGRIAPWAKSHNFPFVDMIALYYQDPSTTPPDELRSHAGVLVPHDFELTDPELELVEVKGGTYAVTTHRGPYDTLSNAWMKFYGEYLPSSGYELAAAPPFELYIVDCDNVPPEDILTELWISVKVPISAPA